MDLQNIEESDTGYNILTLLSVNTVSDIKASISISAIIIVCRQHSHLHNQMMFRCTETEKCSLKTSDYFSVHRLISLQIICQSVVTDSSPCDGTTMRYVTAPQLGERPPCQNDTI